MRCWFRAALVAAALVFTPVLAAAELQLAVDLDAIFPVEDRLDEKTGFGVSGRLGYRLPARRCSMLVPELQLGYVNFAEPSGADAINLSLMRVVGGLRAGVGTVLRPSAFAHIGYGRTALSEEDDPDFFGSRGGIGEENAFTWDVGLALDLTILPLLDVGVHGAYSSLDLDESLNWWSAGVHAALIF